jgi:type II secretory ATPase GspE/PulE/Tfp pilus assembly ATPase PilB-like protein
MPPPRPLSEDGVVQLVDDLLRRARADRASDVHLELAGDAVRVRFRIDGILHDVDRLPATLAENIVARLKVLGGLLTYRVDVPQEGSFTFASEVDGAIDTRVATFPTIRGERVVIRFLATPTGATALDELGMPASLVHRLRLLVERPHGLLLVTGPAGSGKSTTLCALARHLLAATPGRCVISLEDPVEQRVDGLTQVQIQPHGELDYAKALRSLLRQDVQVLLVGEIRDAATARIVIEAALTGHLIISTLHSGDPAESIARLLEMGIPPYQLVGALTAVCAQRLLRRVCDGCDGRGCAHCVGSGYRGRIACACLMEVNEPLHAAILRNAPAGALRDIIRNHAGTLLDDARRLLRDGITNRAEIGRVLGVLPDGDDPGESPDEISPIRSAMDQSRSPVCPGLNTKP